MSTNSEPISVDLDELPENQAFDKEILDDESSEENKRELSQSEHDALEEALMQTARRRIFLRKHTKRHRAIATDLV